MKATPVFDLTAVNLTLTPAEARRVIDDPQTIVGVLTAAMAHTKVVDATTDMLEQVAAVRTTKAVKASKPSKHANRRGGDVPVYDCRECGRNFTSTKRLQNHIRKAHEGDQSADTD